MFLGDLSRHDTIGLIIFEHMVWFCLVLDIISGYPLFAFEEP